MYLHENYTFYIQQKSFFLHAITAMDADEAAALYFFTTRASTQHSCDVRPG